MLLKDLVAKPPRYQAESTTKAETLSLSSGLILCSKLLQSCPFVSKHFTDTALSVGTLALLPQRHIKEIPFVLSCLGDQPVEE